MNTSHTKVVLITGTSSGFGMLSALEIANRGHRVIATMRDLDRASTLRRMARDQGIHDRLVFHALDVTDESQVEAVINQTREECGALDVLINNAGIAGHGFIEDIPLSAWRSTFEANLFGAVACVRAVLPSMRARQSGTIINIGSVAGRIASPGAAVYSATKLALEAFSEALRLEVAPFGIQVAIVEPGAYKTAIWSKTERIYAPDDSSYAQGIQHLTEWVAEAADHSADPREVARLIADLVETKPLTLRYPVGQVGTVSAEAMIKSYLTSPWEAVEARWFSQG